MRQHVLLALLTVPLLSACGGGSAIDPLEDDLPALVPTLAEVSQHFPERRGEPAEVDRGYWPNDEVTEWDQYSIHSAASSAELENRGRATGYRADYILGEQNQGEQSRFLAMTFGVVVRVDLFEDDESARADIDRLPDRSHISDALAEIGDQSVAWGYELWTSPDGIEPRCPCEFRFRVGRMVGYVHAWYSFPFRDSPAPYMVDFDPADLAMAAQMAERMREALAQQ